MCIINDNVNQNIYKYKYLSIAQKIYNIRGEQRADHVWSGSGDPRKCFGGKRFNKTLISQMLYY